jgi:hypothetical protein
METWRLRKELTKLDEVEIYLYNAMIRKPKHINCPNIVLRLSDSGLQSYGLYCENHSVYLQWVSQDLLTPNTFEKWSKLGIERTY